MRIKLIKIVKILLIIVIFLAIGGFIYLKSQTYSPNDFALENMKSNQDITIIQTKDYISFTNKDINLETGYLFYPGGLVEPQSYAPICNKIAHERKICVIAIMPLNLAVLDINKADLIFKEFNSVQNWIVGGHSLGGSMAARFIQNHNSNKVKGLFLLGSYSDIDISSKNVNVLSIVGKNDVILNNANYDKYKTNLPSSSKFIELDGANHSQMGAYGLQKGDLNATISNDEQITKVTTYLLNM